MREKVRENKHVVKSGSICFSVFKAFSINAGTFLLEYNRKIIFENKTLSNCQCCSEQNVKKQNKLKHAREK